MSATGASWRRSADKRTGSSPPARTRQASIIIVNFKSYAELDVCLASLSSASSHDTEIVIVDHASSPEALARVKAAHPGFVAAPTTENRGFSAGVNAGVRLASGRHLVFLNPDTQVKPGAIEAMVSYLDAHPDTAVVGARVENPGGTVQRSARRFPTMLTGLAGRSSLVTRLWPGNPLSRRDVLADASTASPREVDWVAGSCMAVRAEAFEQV